MAHPSYPVLRSRLSDRVAPTYLSRSSLHRLAGLPCRLFLSHGLQVVTRDVGRGHRIDVLCQGTLYFSHIADYFYDFCPLSDTDVSHYVVASHVEHTSFHFGLCGHTFVLVW